MHRRSGAAGEFQKRAGRVLPLGVAAPARRWSSPMVAALVVIALSLTGHASPGRAQHSEDPDDAAEQAHAAASADLVDFEERAAAELAALRADTAARLLQTDADAADELARLDRDHHRLVEQARAEFATIEAHHNERIAEADRNIDRLRRTTDQTRADVDQAARALRRARSDGQLAARRERQANDDLRIDRTELRASAVGAYLVGAGGAVSGALEARELTDSRRAEIYGEQILRDRLRDAERSRQRAGAARADTVSAARAADEAADEISRGAQSLRVIARSIAEALHRRHVAEAERTDARQARDARLDALESELRVTTASIRSRQAEARNALSAALDATLAKTAERHRSARTALVERIDRARHARDHARLQSELAALTTARGPGERPGGSRSGPEPAPRAPLRSTAPPAPTIAGLGFPEVALRAFERAASAMPSCGLRWQVLAGISKVESNHGQIFGSAVLADGTTTRTILGPVLDGSRGFLAVVDTDGGRLDGDTRWDRAVGPMQFIPESWHRLGRDGDRDGVADPHDYDDAALGAANLLCRSGPGLDDERRLRSALLRYNRSAIYGDQVIGWALAYERVRPGPGPVLATPRPLQRKPAHPPVSAPAPSPTVMGRNVDGSSLPPDPAETQTHRSDGPSDRPNLEPSDVLVGAPNAVAPKSAFTVTSTSTIGPVPSLDAERGSGPVPPVDPHLDRADAAPDVAGSVATTTTDHAR